MVKAYLNYKHCKQFSSVITNRLRNIEIVNVESSLCFLAGGNENVFAISLKSGKILGIFQHIDKIQNLQVAQIKIIDDYILIAYSNGDIMSVKDQNSQNLFVKHQTSVCGMFPIKYKNFLWNVSGSQDKKIYVWDIEMNEEIYELKGMSGVLSGVEQNGEEIFILSKDGILRIFNLENGNLLDVILTSKNELLFNIRFKVDSKQVLIVSSGDEEFLLYDCEQKKKEVIVFKREGFNKILQIIKKGDLIFCLTENKFLEIYKILNQEEIKKKYKRKVKRKVKNLDSFEDYIKVFSNHLIFQQSIKLPSNYKSFQFYYDKQSKNTFLLFLTFLNSFDSFLIDLEKMELKQNMIYSYFGHQNPINWVILSSDDYYILSSSSECLCLWDANDCSLIKKLPFRNTTIGQFLKNENFVIFGTDKGEIAILNLKLSEIIQSTNINQNNENKTGINSLCLLEQINSKFQDILAVASDYNLFKLRIHFGNDIKVQIIQKFKLNEHPKKILPFYKSSNFLVSFLDNSIKQFYDKEEIKEKLSFYGHVLQVNDYDLSNDDYVLASVSSDKSIRIWDTDFGNCRRIINKAHDSTILKIKILKDTHYAITTAKDNFVKFWDLDTFGLIMRFEASMGKEIRSLCISAIGDFFIIGGVNKTLRKYIQTKEQVFEIELQEKLKEEQMIDDNDNEEKEVKIKQQQNLRTSEEFMDLIQSIEENNRQEQEEFENDLLVGKKREKPSFGDLNGKNPAEYVLDKLSKIPRDKLDSVLGFFHLNSIVPLLYYINYAVSNQIFMGLCLHMVNFIILTQKNNLLGSEAYRKIVKMIIKKL